MTARPQRPQPSIAAGPSADAEHSEPRKATNSVNGLPPHLGDRIRRRRLRSGKSLRQLAREVGIPQARCQ